jgi:hypothetical protein
MLRSKDSRGLDPHTLNERFWVRKMEKLFSWCSVVLLGGGNG